MALCITSGQVRRATGTGREKPEYDDHFDQAKRSHIGPFFGWLAAQLPLYPSTQALKTLLHLRDDGTCPYIELEPIDHPLAIEQRTGITVDRLAQIYDYMEYQDR